MNANGESPRIQVESRDSEIVFRQEVMLQSYCEGTVGWRAEGLQMLKLAQSSHVRRECVLEGVTRYWEPRGLLRQIHICCQERRLRSCLEGGHDVLRTWVNFLFENVCRLAPWMCGHWQREVKTGNLSKAEVRNHIAVVWCKVWFCVELGLELKL